MEHKHLDLIALPPRFDSASVSTSARGSPLGSPRREHVAGDVAPAMSPLDSLAAQSRALARQLDESRRADNRISRLPPLTVADGFIKRGGGSSGWKSHSPSSAGSRSAGHTPGEGFSPPYEESGIKLAIESPTSRPKSQYPRYSQVPTMAEPEQAETVQDERLLTPQEHVNTGYDYFGGPRTQSPERVGPARPSLESTSQKSSFSSMSKQKTSMESHRNIELARGLSIESTSSRFSQYSSQHNSQLQPPNPPYARKTPSLRSVSSDDDNPGITPSSSFSQHRKLSSSSGTSLPLSPQFQYRHAHNRSTSQLSETSMGGNRTSRPAYNFSRPLSRASGRPSTESPSRISIDSHTRIYSDEDVRPSMETTMSPEHELDDQGGSYVYSKYSLPRGRMVDRESLPLESLMPTIDFNTRAPPPVNPVPLQIRKLEDEAGRSSSESLPTRRPPPPIDLGHQHRHSMTSMNTSNTSNSASTIKASKHNPTPSNSDMTAEAHLEKGIALHEKGSLKESTYHLRLAAKRNNPTAMLLYALACRHGWGMRQSPSEGVAWLRKAIDYANVAMNESEHSEGAPSAIQRTKRAQFALGVYELGVSHMNGWGVDNDKVLALRCFEIASAWGDADAMAEAGFCYYQGVGCKKDLKKAATYYRQAEAKGVSMVGNSWIHKSKYDTKPDGDERGRGDRQGDDKKKRDKSRTRTLFSRKRSDR